MKTKLLFLAAVLFAGVQHTQAQITLTHHVDPETIEVIGLACWFTGSGEYKDNRLARTYDLNAFDIIEDFEITAVEFGQGSSDDGKIIHVNIYTSSSEDMTVATHTLVSTTELSLLAINDFSLISVAIDPIVIPAGSIIMVETFCPAHASLKYFPGFNLAGHSGTSWVKVPDCGITEWTDSNSLQSNQQHILINIVGDVALGLDDELVSNVSAYPNPTTGNFAINLGRSYNEVDVVVTNIIGQRISSSTVKNADKISLSIEGRQGIYFVRINTSEGRLETIKVILK